MSRIRSSPMTWLLVTWVASRLAMVALGVTHGMAELAAPFGDVVHYEGWARAVAHQGALPWHDPGWAYPAGALPLLLLPGVAGWHSTYLLGFILEMLAFDALALVGLITLGRRPGWNLYGAWLWVLALPALGPLALGRFDVAPVSLTVCALVLMSNRPRGAGALLAVAALVKLWPGLLIAALWRHTRLLAAAIVTLVVGLGITALLVGRDGLTAAFTFQQHRGLQQESLAALPFMALRALGVEGYDVVWDHGAYQVIGPGTAIVSTSCTLALVLFTCATGVFAARSLSIERRLALIAGYVTVMVLVDKVLSPQYLLWIAAPLAVWAAVTGSTRRLTIAAFLGACVTTQVIATFGYRALRHGETLPVAGLAVRDMLLLVTAGLLLRRAFRPRPPTPEQGASAAPPDRTTSSRPFGHVQQVAVRSSVPSSVVRNSDRTLLIHGAIVLLVCTLIAQTVYWPWVDWHIFQAAADRGWNAYVAADPLDRPLTGPLTIALAALISGQVATFMIILVLPAVAIRERIPLRFSIAAAPIWAVLAASQHLDDALAIGLLVESRHHSGYKRGLLVGLAIAFKPWAVLGLPLLWRDRPALAAGAAVQAVWIPFLPDLIAMGGTTVPVQGNTPLRLFLDYHADPADWLRIVQLILAAAAVAWCLRRGKWDAALLVGLIARLATDPGDFAYYWGSAALAALLLVRSRALVFPLLYAAIVISLIHAKGLPGAIATTALMIAVIGVAFAQGVPEPVGDQATDLPTGHLTTPHARSKLRSRLGELKPPRPVLEHPSSPSMPQRAHALRVSEQTE